MFALRRVAAAAFRLPKRQRWHQLSAFTDTEEDVNAFKNLRSNDLKLGNVIERFKRSDSVLPIDWKLWEETIGHKDILISLKNFYDHQISLINDVLKEDHSKVVLSQNFGWELFESAVSSCEKSVEKSEILVENAAKALWISYNNPPIWQIDTNEWVESDKYWQAYIEKHHFYNPNPTGNDPETTAEIEEKRSAWHRKVAEFNDRSDNPILYRFMDQLPSWEYYDLHRRALLEHMTYYLLRTGGDYRLFPECPPWQWLSDIEDLRYRFIAVTQRRRAHFQLENEEVARPLDMQPLDYEHDGESFHLNLLQSEVRIFNLTVSRLMGNFMFLVHPFIPVQSYTSLVQVLVTHGEGGRFFHLGNDVNALFYLPTDLKIPRPKDSLYALLDYLTMTGRKMNPGYAALLDLQTEILEKRGNIWLTLPGETVADMFMRRLNSDDPYYPIYEMYVQEMKDRFSSATEISKEEAFKLIKSIEDLNKIDEEVYKKLLYSLNVDVSLESKKSIENLTQIDEDEFSNLINLGFNKGVGGIAVISEKDEDVESKKQDKVALLSSGVSTAQELRTTLLEDFASFDKEKEQVAEHVKNIKIVDIEKVLNQKSKI